MQDTESYVINKYFLGKVWQGLEQGLLGIRGAIVALSYNRMTKLFERVQREATKIMPSSMAQPNNKNIKRVKPLNLSKH